jgi:anti-sigma-K factor RskA
VARTDAVVAIAIQGWELRLAALADGIPGITPPPRVWQGIRARLGLSDPADTARAGGRPPWWSSLSLWRGLALAGFALAFALAITVLAPTSERPFESVVVVLAGPDGQTLQEFTATADLKPFPDGEGRRAGRPSRGRALEL